MSTRLVHHISQLQIGTSSDDAAMGLVLYFSIVMVIEKHHVAFITVQCRKNNSQVEKEALSLLFDIKQVH